jgi:lipid A 3-O-deacylase
MAAGIIMVLFFAAVGAAADGGDPGKSRSAYSLCWENDAFDNSDANYTNGGSLAVANERNGLLGGIWNLPGKAEGRRFSVYELTQLQFTPTDLNLINPDQNDRPYAGFLYVGLTSFLQNKDSLHGFKLLVGIIGPASLSETLQKATHHIIGSSMPQGWDYQLKNEPVINLAYEYRRRIPLLSSASKVDIDLVPMGSAMAGNYLVQAEAGMHLRIGYRLAGDFGTSTLRGIGYLPFPEDDAAWRFYIFGGGHLDLVARDVTLDGNTFARSRSVDKRIFKQEGEFGISVSGGPMLLSFVYVMMGKEFYGQQHSEDYGSLLFSWVTQ